MKKSISVILAGILMISLTACQGDVGERITKNYQNMESYTAIATVTVSGNKGNSVYEVKQSYQAPDSYRVEVIAPGNLAGTVSVMVGDKVWLKSGDYLQEALELSGEQGPDLLFPVELLNRYIRQESGTGMTEGADGTVLLTETMENGNRYRMSQNLFLDGDSLLPQRLITYNRDGDEAFRVEYREFQKDVTFEKGEFSL